MSVNKDFVVKNGLEVNGVLIRTDIINNRVGINTNIINATLDVNGAIASKSLSISGLTSFTSFNVTNQIQLNGSSGSNGQYLKSTGTGVTWSNFPVARTSDITTGVLGQTLFPFNYTIGLVDVFVNGTKLAPSEFTAVDGLNIILSNPCVGGETVELISYSATTLGITTTIGLEGITVREEGSPVGTFGKISSLDFVGSGVTAIGSGIGVTIYINDGINPNYWDTTAAGIHTLSNVGVGTTNPTSKFTVTGDALISGLTTTTDLYVAGIGTFLSSGLKIRNPANTFGYTITGGAITANRNLTLPLITADDTVAVLGLAQTFSAAQTFSSTLTASSTLTLTGSTTGTHVFGSNQTSGTITLGGPSGTGLITLGRATTSQQTNIQAGASGVGTTKTINFGTGGLANSNTIINIGPTAGVGTVSINTGTNLGIGSATPTQKLDVVGSVKVGINTSQGVILTSPNGTKYQLFVENDGTLKTVAV